MTEVWNVAIAFINLSDAGVITAPNSLALTPPSLLQNIHVSRKCRASVHFEAYTVDLLSAQFVDTVAMMGSNMTAGGISRLRASATDSSAVAGELYDSGNVVGKVDPKFGYLIFLLTSPVAARYLRIDIGDGAVANAEMGRLFVGLRTQFAINFQPGWGRGRVDRSRHKESKAGLRFSDIDNSYRTLELTLAYMTDSERNNVIEEMDRLSGEHGDALVLTDPSSANLGRDSIWGYQPSMQLTTQPGAKTGHTRTLRINERL